MKKQKQLIEKIMNWDKRNVYQLLELINEYRETIQHDINDLAIDPLHLDSLPTVDSVKINGVDFELWGISHYPAWAMDEKGNCLVGDTANRIEKIYNIYETMLDK